MEDLLSGAPPALDLGTRPGVLTPAEARARAHGIPLPAARGELLTGLALLWHDDWHGAHAVAQAHEGRADFDLLHAIGHRREGDYANSKYWFRSAGRHPCFSRLEPALAREIPEGDPLRSALAPKGRWSPAAFVDLVAESLGRGRSGTSEKDAEISLRLVRVQALEMRAFADWLLDAA